MDLVLKQKTACRPGEQSSVEALKNMVWYLFVYPYRRTGQPRSYSSVDKRYHGQN